MNLETKDSLVSRINEFLTSHAFARTDQAVFNYTNPEIIPCPEGALNRKIESESYNILTYRWETTNEEKEKILPLLRNIFLNITSHYNRGDLIILQKPLEIEHNLREDVFYISYRVAYIPKEKI